jgi:hypothetical protein
MDACDRRSHGGFCGSDPGAREPRSVFKPGSSWLAQDLPSDKPRRLLQAVRYAFPQRHAIGFIVALMLIVAAVGAIEP